MTEWCTVGRQMNHHNQRTTDAGTGAVKQNYMDIEKNEATSM